MNRRHILIFALSLISGTAVADEGMWLPSLISERIEDMQAKGFELSAEDIYSINQASLKDAVVPTITAAMPRYSSTARWSMTISATASGP